VATWTRAGSDGIAGLPGPRWTDRWGVNLALRGKLSTEGTPLELEERLETAVWLGSVGQTFSWRSLPRLTDRIWRPRASLFSAGGFVDFAGVGPAPRADEGGTRFEGFPIYLSITYDVAAQAERAAPAAMTEESALLAPFGSAVVGVNLALEFAYARSIGPRGDLRYVNHRLEVRNVRTATGTQRTGAWDFEALSGRNIALGDSPWSLSGRVGLSILVPLEARREDQLERASVVPLLSAGIAHRADEPWLRSHRSEIGRPLVDSTDFGVELGTLHRLVETVGIDAGVQATGWIARQVSPRISVYGEGMAGLASRRERTEADGSWIDASGAIVLLRAEVGARARLLGGLDLTTRLWVEDSDRADPMHPTRRVSSVEVGLDWQR
jgi:hypothetical protein